MFDHIFLISNETTVKMILSHTSSFEQGMAKAITFLSCHCLKLSDMHVQVFVHAVLCTFSTTCSSIFDSCTRCELQSLRNLGLTDE